MVATWITIFFIAAIGIAIVAFCIYIAVDSDTSTGGRIVAIIGAVIAAIAAIAICLGLHWYLYNTEAGSRAIRDWQSNTKGGIERTVTVYDIEGDVLAVYSGKFDVESSDTRIKFDDEDGKRHIIYFTTGTVTIDEN